MKNTNSLNLTRRSFIVGGAAALSVAGLSATGCKATKGSGEDGDTIKCVIAYQDSNCDPVGNSTVLFVAAGLHVFEGLYEIDYHTFRPYNGLAALAPKKINDYTYDVTLRDGATFSDGTAVTVDDVVRSFELNIKDDNNGPMLNFIKTISSKDSKTVTFTLNYPFESLIQERLAIVRVFPAKQTAEERKSMPIGSGPYAYKSINGTDGGKVEFVKNEYYNGKYPATANTMEWQVLVDDTSRTTALNEKSVHAIESVPDQNADQLKSAGATVEYIQSFSCPMVHFNMLKEPFSDVRVRQAFMYAIDYDKLIDNVMLGHATPATSFLPKNHSNYHRATTVYTHNTEKAKELLKSAGAEGLKFTLMINSNWVRDLGPQIKNDLEDAGFKCSLDVQKIQWNSVTDYEGTPDFDVMLQGSDATHKGNDADLCMSLFVGDSVWARGRTCWKRATNSKWPELQDLLQRAKEATGTPQQTLWNNCFDLIAEECVSYPLFHREVPTGYWQDLLTDFKPISTTGLVFLGVTAKEI